MKTINLRCGCRCCWAFFYRLFVSEIWIRKTIPTPIFTSIFNYQIAIICRKHDYIKLKISIFDLKKPNLFFFKGMRVRNAHMCTHRMNTLLLLLFHVEWSQETKKRGTKNCTHTICCWPGISIMRTIFSAAAATTAAVDDIVVSLSTFLIR